MQNSGISNSEEMKVLKVTNKIYNLITGHLNKHLEGDIQVMRVVVSIIFSPKATLELKTTH